MDLTTSPTSSPGHVPGLSGFLLHHRLDSEGLLRNQFEHLLTKCGLTWRGLPDRSPTTAFQAATPPDRTTHVVKGIPNPPDPSRPHLTLAMKSHLTTDRVVERRIEKSYWGDGGYASTAPVEVGRLVLHKTKTGIREHGQYQVIMNHHRLLPGEAALVRQFTTKVTTDAQQRQFAVDAGNLRSMMNDLLTYEADGLSLGRSGLWYVPAHAGDMVRRLTAFVDLLGGESYVHTVPVPDRPEDRAMVEKALVAHLRAQGTRLITTMDQTQGFWAERDRAVPMFRQDHIRFRMEHMVKVASTYATVLGALPLQAELVLDDVMGTWERLPKEAHRNPAGTHLSETDEVEDLVA